MELEVVLDAPVERVFAFFADPRIRPRWQSILRRVEMITAGEPRLGTRWRERLLGLGWVELEIVRFERDRAWGERAELPFGTFTLTLRFSPEGAVTRVHVDAELALRGPARLLGPGAKLVLPRVFASDLRRAGRILRTGGADPALGG